MKYYKTPLEILKRRYFLRDKSGDIVEDFSMMMQRVARAVAKADASFGATEKEIKCTEEKFFDLLSSLKFLPNSPTLMNAGTKNGQLAACFVLPLKDSLKDIFQTLKETALIHQSGGGTGFSFSSLRPRGDIVKSTQGVSSGPVSFMKIFDMATEIIKQGGKRRGANMGILNVSHPDIIEFIKCKSDLVSFRNFNISVAITDEFLKAYKQKKKYFLINPRDKSVFSEISAELVFDEIVKNAWHSGDPGVIFIDRINSYNPTPKIGNIESTNPCLTADTWVTTDKGPQRIEKLIGNKSKLLLNGKFYSTENGGFFSTGRKSVFEVVTDRGYRVKATAEHLFLVAEKKKHNKTKTRWKKLADLIENEDLLVISNNRGVEWAGDGKFEDGYLLGLSKDFEGRIHTIEAKSSDFYKGFLRGVFDSNGYVRGTQKEGVSIRLSGLDFDTVLAIQRMLLRLGIASKVREKKASIRIVSKNKTDKGASYELVITNDNLLYFSKIVDFSDIKKQTALKEKVSSYSKKFSVEKFLAKVKVVIPLGEKSVFDVVVPGFNAFEANGIIVHNCGEQPLLPYESCTLGSINLTKFVSSGKIDYNALQKTVTDSVHFLDNVIEINHYPVKKIELMSKRNRKIGLGVMGFADMLIMLGISYSSREAISLAEELMAFINTTAVAASRMLAKKRGPFPEFAKSVYGVRNEPIRRNATVTTIAPTGTISIIAGVSSGIEPNYAYKLKRHILDTTFEELHLIYEQMKTAGKTIDRKIFVTAFDVSPEQQLKIQAAFQKYTENAVSKTINLKENAKISDVKEIFLAASEMGLKGITIYRNKSKPSQTLTICNINPDKEC